MSVLESLNKDSYGGGVIGEITSLSLSFKTVRDSFSYCCMSIQWHMDVWISELHVINHNKSLISSQDFPNVIASVIKVLVIPFDLT